MSVRVFVPRDSAARAVGADAVADCICDQARARGLKIDLVRNGSRGMFWLEPLVEVEVEGSPERMAYGPVSPQDVAALFEAGFLCGGQHALSLGPTESVPYLARQQRLTFSRMGVTDPLSLRDYEAHGGLQGLGRAIGMTAQDLIREVTASGLRGRGGAAFPTGIKWGTVLRAAGSDKSVVCNADEGDSGTFSDRMVMEGDPFMLIEGMIIAGLATDASRGYVYVRSEYPQAVEMLGKAVEIARAAGILGNRVMGSDRAFDIVVRKGAGSYVCGEETALLESLEGKRGIVRAKPPVPAVAGLFGKPTACNNVITLASVPRIVAQGGADYAALGTERSRGTLPFQLSGNVRQGGLVELPFGITLRQLIEDFGGGTASGRPVKAVQVGGPLGAYVPAPHWDTPIDYEAYAAFGATVGHGGIVVHDDRSDMMALARYAMEFCAIESCGKCTPCRIGSTRGVEVIDRIARGTDREAQVTLLRDLCDTMTHASLCAMGSMTPNPVLSAMALYPEDFGLMPAGAVRQSAEPGHAEPRQ